MVAHIKTIAFSGVEAVPVDVQVHLAPGQNAFTIVGLPDKSIAESRERVRAAIAAIGLGLPYDRITINLAPADLPKEGSHYDLPIALGLLVALNALEQTLVDDFLVIGECAAGLMATRRARIGDLQIDRQGCLNGRLDGDWLRALARPGKQGAKWLDRVIEENRISARGFNRILRVARTLADLMGHERPGEAEIASAMAWRGGFGKWQ